MGVLPAPIARLGWMLSVVLPLQVAAMPVEQAVEAGLLINPKVLSAVAEAQRAGTNVDIAKGSYYPAVSLSGGPQEFDFGEIVYDLSASQMLYDWGRVTNKVESANALQRKSLEELLVARDDAALDIVETYLELLATEHRLASVRKNIEQVISIREMTEVRGAGYSDRSELDRANLELSRALEQLYVETGKLNDLSNQFEILVGSQPKNLQMPEPPSLQSYLAKGDMTKLINTSPLQRKALEDANVAEAELREAKASLLPQLNLEASHLRREIGGRMEEDSMVSLRFRMDTIQGLSNFYRPTAAQQRLEAARYTADAMQRDIRRKLQSLFDSAETLGWREQTLVQQVSQAEQVTGLYREQFEVGRRDVIDLLNVQREHFDAERQLINLKFEQKSIEYRAAAQVGLLGAMLEKRLIHES